MAASIKVESCRLCDENLPKKSRRSIFSEHFTVRDQLTEILGRLPNSKDGESAYVCSACFNKLNRLNKLEFDISNKLSELNTQKIHLVEELRGKYLNNKSSKSPHTTPRKLHKRVISHSPTPRKVKNRPEPVVEEELTIQLSRKPKKMLLMPGPGIKSKEFTPGKVKVLYRNEGKDVQSKVVKETDLKEIIKGLARGSSLKLIGKKLLQSKLSDSIQDAIVKKLDKESKELSKLSLLSKCSSSELHNFNFQHMNIQTLVNAPLLYRILDTLTRKNEIMNTVISSFLLRCRNIQLSRMHHIVAQILDHGGATDETINILNKLGVCVGAKAAAKKRTQLQESQKDHIKELVLNEVESLNKESSEFGKLPVESLNLSKSSQIIGDNLDITRTPSKMSKERQRKSWHWFLLVGVQNRLTFPDLPDGQPQADITTLENKAFVPSTEECRNLDDHLSYHILRVLVKYIPSFRQFQSLVPKNIVHPYMSDTSKKSDYAILDLLDKSENKSDDMISILEHIHDNYIAHTDDESPFVIKKKVFGGDVLTNERAYTAQLAMMNSPTDYTKLKGVIHRPEGLHRMMNFLLFIYQRFYKYSSAADPGTLYQLRNIIGRVDVKGPDDVVSSYRSHYSFIEDCLDGYIVGACMHMLGMKTIDSDPPRQPFLCQEDKYSYINGVSKNILDKYVKISEDITGIQQRTRKVDQLKLQMEEMFDSSNRIYICTCGKQYKTEGWFKKHLALEHDWNFTVVAESDESKLDHIAIYRSSFMKCALLLRDTNDAFKYGDGDRILRNSKFEMLCADVGKHSKYRLWLFRFIAYCSALLSKRQSMEYLWNCTANLSGGLDKNIPNDNLVEIQVQSIKKKINQQGANATFQSARKVALSTQVQDLIRENLSGQCDVKSRSRRRPVVSKDNDIRLIINELFKSNVFEYQPGRQFDGFPSIKDIFSYIKTDQLCNWLTDQKERASNELL